MGTWYSYDSFRCHTVQSGWTIYSVTSARILHYGDYRMYGLLCSWWYILQFCCNSEIPLNETINPYLKSVYNLLTWKYISRLSTRRNVTINNYNYIIINITPNCNVSLWVCFTNLMHSAGHKQHTVLWNNHHYVLCISIIFWLWCWYIKVMGQQIQNRFISSKKYRYLKV